MDNLRAAIRAIVYDAIGYDIDRMSDEDEDKMIDDATDRIMATIAAHEKEPSEQ